MNEHPNYREELAQIKAHFGGKQTIKWREVQEYTGRGYKWCSNHLPVPHDGCTAQQLAKALATLNGGRT